MQFQQPSRVPRFLFVLFVSFLTVSCAQTVETVADDRLITTAAENLDQGYVLIGIDSNETLQSIYLTGPRSIRLSEEDLEYGSNYLLFAVPAGTYTFDEIRLNRFYEFELEDSDNIWSIDVYPNRISYVGDLHIKVNYGYLSAGLALELINRSSYALQFLERRFPLLLQSYELAYGGVGDDAFLEFVTAREGVK